VARRTRWVQLLLLLLLLARGHFVSPTYSSPRPRALAPPALPPRQIAVVLSFPDMNPTEGEGPHGTHGGTTTELRRRQVPAAIEMSDSTTHELSMNEVTLALEETPDDVHTA
jgi:hypothetical protein